MEIFKTPLKTLGVEYSELTMIFLDGGVMDFKLAQVVSTIGDGE